MFKRLLFVLVVLLSVGNLFAQPWVLRPRSYDGFKDMSKKGLGAKDTVLAQNVAIQYIAPDAIPNVTIQSFPNSQSYLDNRNSWDWVRYSYGAKDTLNGGTDNLALIWNDSTNLSNVFSNWWAGEIEVDDTTEICSDATFPRGKTIKVLPGRLVPLVKRNITYLNNIYLRRFVTPGATGTINWNIRFWGF